MRRFLIALAACVAAGSPAMAETFVQCDVKLELPGGRLEARLFGDGKSFSQMGEASVVVPVAKDFLLADPPHAFDLADPAGQTAEYRVHLRYEWIGEHPPAPFSKAGAKHPWWPVGDTFTGPAIVEEFGSTIPVHPGFEVVVDDWANLVIRKESAR